MNTSELTEIASFVHGAAREAAALARRGFRSKNLVVSHKGVVDLVTEFDVASEALLRERLAKLPFRIVGEEHGISGAEQEHVFYIDPIDGTTNFVHGHPFWCVSVGLVANGLPILGVVVAPILGLEWIGTTASDGTRSARRHIVLDDADEVCSVSTLERFEDSLLATGFPYDRKTSADNNFDAFVAIKRKCQAVRRCGSAALDLCFVADGTYEGYWERKLNPWDIAGGTALVRAAGGRVTDYDGDETYIASGHCIATNGAIHDRLHDELSRVVPSVRPPA